MSELTTKLLVIDDDAEIKGTISDYLEDSGYTVIQAVNGRDGLELFSRQSPLDRVFERASLIAKYRESQEALREFVYPHVDTFDGLSTSINVRQQTNYRHLEKELYNCWELGRNVILSWGRRPTGLEILVVPHDFVATFHADHSNLHRAQSS